MEKPDFKSAIRGEARIDEDPFTIRFDVTFDNSNVHFERFKSVLKSRIVAYHDLQFALRESEISISGILLYKTDIIKELSIAYDKSYGVIAI